MKTIVVRTVMTVICLGLLILVLFAGLYAAPVHAGDIPMSPHEQLETAITDLTNSCLVEAEEGGLTRQEHRDCINQILGEVEEYLIQANSDFIK